MYINRNAGRKINRSGEMRKKKKSIEMSPLPDPPRLKIPQQYLPAVGGHAMTASFLKGKRW